MGALSKKDREFLGDLVDLTRKHTGSNLAEITAGFLHFYMSATDSTVAKLVWLLDAMGYDVILRSRGHAKDTGKGEADNR